MCIRDRPSIGAMVLVSMAGLYTHMIGGYAQQAYGFNYYGTVGANRDEFVVLRKMKKVDWMEGPLVEDPAAATQLEEKQS